MGFIQTLIWESCDIFQARFWPQIGLLPGPTLAHRDHSAVTNDRYVVGESIIGANSYTVQKSPRMESSVFPMSANVRHSASANACILADPQRAMDFLTEEIVQVVARFHSLLAPRFKFQ